MHPDTNTADRWGDLLLLDDFASELRREDLSPLTVTAYVGDVRALADWYRATYGRDLVPGDLGSIDLQDYRAYMQTVRHRAPAGINRALASIRRWLRYTASKGAIRGAVPTITDVEAAPLAPKSPAAGDVHSLVRSAEKKGQLAYAVVMLLKCTGARVGEVAGTRLPDIRIEARSGEWLVHGKGRKTRTVALNAYCRAALRAWLAVRPNVPHDFLFVGQRGDPLGTRGIRYIISILSDGELHPHALRHHVAYQLTQPADGRAPENLVTVARQLGHARLTSTQIYTQPQWGDLERVADRL